MIRLSQEIILAARAMEHKAGQMWRGIQGSGGEEAAEELLLNVSRIRDEENVLEADSADGCMTL